MNSKLAEPLVRFEGVEKHFGAPWGGSAVRAVDGVTLDIRPGEVLGLVGESGCGKSTLGRLALRLLDPTNGTVYFDGVDITKLPKRRLRAIRRRAQMVFQDPASSLNPRYKIGQILAQVLRLHRVVPSNQVDARVTELLQQVGLNPSVVNSYPGQLSGGMQQRVGIARALCVSPKFLVADEAVSALDVSTQAQIVNLLGRLQQEFGLTMLFISHDLGVVRQIADRIAVMYLGRVIEVAKRDELVSNPRHPYTEALLSAVPISSPEVNRTRKRIILSGDLPSASNPPSGCRFRTRCPIAVERCADEPGPSLLAVEGEHRAACHFPLDGSSAAIRGLSERVDTSTPTAAGESQSRHDGG